MVEDKGVEPLTLPCKGSVFPLAPIPHISLFISCCYLSQQLFLWPGERDSNPRKALTFNGFQDRRFRPLSHLPYLYLDPIKYHHHTIQMPKTFLDTTHSFCMDKVDQQDKKQSMDIMSPSIHIFDTDVQ